MRNDKVKSLIANTIDLYSDTNINQEIINNGLLKLEQSLTNNLGSLAGVFKLFNH